MRPCASIGRKATNSGGRNYCKAASGLADKVDYYTPAKHTYICEAWRRALSGFYDLAEIGGNLIFAVFSVKNGAFLRYFTFILRFCFGSTPLSSTMKPDRQTSLSGFIYWRADRGARGGKRRSAGSTADLTALGLGCQPCAAHKRQVPSPQPQKGHRSKFCALFVCRFNPLIYFFLRLSSPSRSITPFRTSTAEAIIFSAVFIPSSSDCSLLPYL